MKRRLTRWIAGLAAAACLLINAVPVFAVPVKAEGPDIFGNYYCLMNADTGEVICEKNMNDRSYPASTTKIMTALLTLENVSDRSQMLTYSDNAINGISIHSSTMTPKGKVGEVMSVQDTLHGLMLVSGNECAVALAEFVAGTEEEFSRMMNERAARIGAVNTRFNNPHGLHEEIHYTTAYDIALIFREALKNPDFVKLTSTGKYTISATNLTEPRALSHGHMMVSGDYAYPYAVAGKSGYTAEAGRTMLTYAEKDGVRLIAVVYQSTHEKIWKDTQMLFDYGFGLLAGETEEVNWEPINTAWKVKKNVNVREFPSTTADIVGSLDAGGSVTCLAKWDEWMKISYAGGTYYVHVDYLQDPAAAETTPPATTPAPTTPAPTEPSDSQNQEQTPDVPDETMEEPQESQPHTEEAPESTQAVVNENGGGNHTWILWTMSVITLLLAAALTGLIIIWVKENFI